MSCRAPWLKSVDYNREKGLSIWTLESLGLSFKWTSQNIFENAPYELAWKSLNGLPNKGRVVFSTPSSNEKDGSDGGSGDNTQTTSMVLTISVDLPDLALAVFKSLGRFYNKLLSDALCCKLRLFLSCRSIWNKLHRGSLDGRSEEIQNSHFEGSAGRTNAKVSQ